MSIYLKKNVGLLMFLLAFGCDKNAEKQSDEVEQHLNIAENCAQHDDDRIQALRQLTEHGDRRCLPRLYDLLKKTDGGPLTREVLFAISRMPSKSSLPILYAYTEFQGAHGATDGKLNAAVKSAIEVCQNSGD